MHFSINCLITRCPADLLEYFIVNSLFIGLFLHFFLLSFSPSMHFFFLFISSSFSRRVVQFTHSFKSVEFFRPLLVCIQSIRNGISFSFKFCRHPYYNKSTSIYRRFFILALSLFVHFSPLSSFIRHIIASI